MTVSTIARRYQNPSGNAISRMRLTSAGAIASNAATIINTVISANPSSSSEWSSVTNLYDEFRVIGMRIKLVSLQQYSVTAANGYAVVAFDNSDSIAFSSLDFGHQLETSKIFSAIFQHAAVSDKDSALCYSFVRPSSGKSAIEWVDTGNPALSLGSIKFYASNLTASTNYWNYTVEWFIEVRGRI